MHDDSSEFSDLVKQEIDFLKSNLEDYRRKGITALDILRVVMQKNNFFLERFMTLNSTTCYINRSIVHDKDKGHKRYTEKDKAFTEYTMNI